MALFSVLKTPVFRSNGVEVVPIVTLFALSASCALMFANVEVLLNEPAVMFAYRLPFSNSKVPLGTTFVDSPATTFFNSLFLNLVNYKTTGKYAFNSETGEAIETPMPHMHLEGAKQIDIYYTAEQKVDVSDKEDSSTPMQKIVDKEGKEVKKYIHTISDNKDNPYFDVSKAIQALNNATKVDFTIRDGLK